MSGVRVKLPVPPTETRDLWLSCQTSAHAAGEAFCETALTVRDSGIIYDDKLGYWDVVRHREPEDFREHLISARLCVIASLSLLVPVPFAIVFPPSLLPLRHADLIKHFKEGTPVPCGPDESPGEAADEGKEAAAEAAA